MIRATISSVLFLVCLGSASWAQSDKPYTPAVGQKYKATVNGAVVIKDAKSTSEFIKARRKVDAEKIMNMMNAGTVERIAEGTVLEVVKVDPKSEEHPSGLI